MSRIANSPIILPSGVEININGQNLRVKGKKGSLEFVIPSVVQLMQNGSILKLAYEATHRTCLLYTSDAADD